MASLNLDAISNGWVPACPVLMPVDAVTMSSIISASMGVFAPFFLFTCALFWHFYQLWTTNAWHTDYDNSLLNNNNDGPLENNNGEYEPLKGPPRSGDRWFSPTRGGFLPFASSSAGYERREAPRRIMPFVAPSRRFFAETAPAPSRFSRS